MKKIVVMFLVLLLLGLSGVDGCAPGGMEDFGIKPKQIAKGEEIVKIRGLTIGFEKDKPLLTSISGERLPVLWAEDEVDIGLIINNHVPKDINADIKVFSLATETGSERKIIYGEDFLTLESADVEDNRVSPSTTIIEFGPFFYSRERIGKYLEDSLIMNVNLDYYDMLVTADLCFSREVDNPKCSNSRTLSENYFKGDAGYLPVSIREIVKQVTVKDNVAKVRLFIKFKNFGNGYIKDNKLSRFSAEIGGVGLDCGDVVFEESKTPSLGMAQGSKEAEVICNGNIGFSGEGAYMTLPSKFEFDYSYEIRKSKSYKVLPE